MSIDFTAKAKPETMAAPIIRTQIYEIQTPAEAEAMLTLGVDHIGSVLLSEADWRLPVLRETVRTVQGAGGQSSLIPLFNTPDAVYRTLDYYGPDIVHFCEVLTAEGGGRSAEELLALQEGVRQRFAQTAIMRSIPIAPPGRADTETVLALARLFEPVSDWFLTDTLQVEPAGTAPGDQPVAGFVGITGKTCDWTVAAELVKQSAIPVILAGGLSPENVFDGCLAVRPAGVDSCTLTNARDADGQPIRFAKDAERVRRFVAETRRAQAALADGSSPPAESRLEGQG